MIGTRVATVLALLLVACMPVSAQEADTSPERETFSFSIEEFKKSPWAVNGYLQGDLIFARLDPDAAFYRIGFLGKEQDLQQLQGGTEIQTGLTFQKGRLTAYALSGLQQRHDGDEWDSDFTLYEGSLSLQASSSVYFTLGKSLLRWGRGYAWNPTNFIGRSKNPSDPDLSLEGYWAALADLVKSFSGPLKTVALTGVILPVSDDVNADFGERDCTNVAGKLYLLFHDTDIDVMALLEGSRTLRYGLTASRNIATNLEVHAELALVADFQRSIVISDGFMTLSEHDASNFLVGIRYLAPTNTTWIFEYYRNGGGYTQAEAEDFFGFIGSAEDVQLQASRANLSDYLAPNFERNYLYMKLSQKEPFGWLYVTPTLFAVVNANDGSCNLVPEVSYTGIENLELRSRLSVLSGAGDTEYGDKVNDWRIELRARYFF